GLQLGHDPAAVQDARGGGAGDELAVAVEDADPGVGALDDELRVRCPHHGDGGLLGGGQQAVAHDLVGQVVGAGAHAAPPGWRSGTAPLADTTAVHPGGTRTVVSLDSTSAGPAIASSTGARSRTRTGVSTQPPRVGNQARRRRGTGAAPATARGGRANAG